MLVSWIVEGVSKASAVEPLAKCELFMCDGNVDLTELHAHAHSSSASVWTGGLGHPGAKLGPRLETEQDFESMRLEVLVTMVATNSSAEIVTTPKTSWTALGEVHGTNAAAMQGPAKSLEATIDAAVETALSD